MKATSSCFHPTQPLLFVAAGNCVYSYDLRVDRLLLEEVKMKYEGSGEEINEVSFLIYLNLNLNLKRTTFHLIIIIIRIILLTR
jgi:hypothetical protein